MTAAEQILSGIEGMRATVSQVTREWEPADLPRVEACRVALEAAMPGAGALPQNIPSDPRLRPAAEALRKDLARLEFLIDAAAAFVRGAASAQGQTYTLAGQLGPAGSVAPTEAYTG